MNQNRRGVVIIVTVLLASGVFGWIYGPSVRATTSSAAEDTQSAVREFTTVLDVVQANYAEPVDVDNLTANPGGSLCRFRPGNANKFFYFTTELCRSQAAT